MEAEKARRKQCRLVIRYYVNYQSLFSILKYFYIDYDLFSLFFLILYFHLFSRFNYISLPFATLLTRLSVSYLLSLSLTFLYLIIRTFKSNEN